MNIKIGIFKLPVFEKSIRNLVNLIIGSYKRTWAFVFLGKHKEFRQGKKYKKFWLGQKIYRGQVYVLQDPSYTTTMA